MDIATVWPQIDLAAMLKVGARMTKKINTTPDSRLVIFRYKKRDRPPTRCRPTVLQRSA